MLVFRLKKIQRMKVLKKVRIAGYYRSQEKKALKNKMSFNRAKYKEGKKKIYEE